MAYNHWPLVVTINGFRSKGEHDKAAQLMEVYSLTEQDVARQNLNTLNEMAESLVKEGRKDDAAKVRAMLEQYEKREK